VLYASDTLRSAATLSDVIKESRRNRVSVDGGTQDFLEVPPDIRAANTNIFFRELPASKDKSKSPIDFLLHSLQLRDPEIRSVIRAITEQGHFTKTRYWFWYNKASRSVEVIRPCPPVFCLHDPKKTSRELFKTYEKHTNEKLLLNSWDDVPRLELANKKKRIKRKSASLGISK
jgi:hypothetical protein